LYQRIVSVIGPPRFGWELRLSLALALGVPSIERSRELHLEARSSLG
jgi:hypothetical protein